MLKFNKFPSLINRNDNDSFHSLQTEMNRLFSNVFNDNQMSTYSSSKMPWSPRVDMKETNNEVIIAADIPGARKEDIEVTLADNILTIKGERHSEEFSKNNDKGYFKERFYGHFERSFSIPDGFVDENSISAEVKNGELIVTLKKIPESKKEVRRIQIK